MLWVNKVDDEGTVEDCGWQEITLCKILLNRLLADQRNKNENSFQEISEMNFIFDYLRQSFHHSIFFLTSSRTTKKEILLRKHSTSCRLIFICCCENKPRKKVRRNFLSRRLSHVLYFSALGFPRLPTFSVNENEERKIPQRENILHQHRFFFLSSHDAGVCVKPSVNIEK